MFTIYIAIGIGRENNWVRVYAGGSHSSVSLRDGHLGATAEGTSGKVRLKLVKYIELGTDVGSSFYLFTHTPCTAIKASPGRGYEVTTPRGVIETRHVVHATNAWASHLLPGLRERIVPLRGIVNAQIPSTGLGWDGTRSFVFFPRDSMDAFDYMTQQPTGEAGSTGKYPSPSGEVMFGGGMLLSKGWIEDVGNTDDRSWNPDTGRHLAGALNGYFGARAAVAAVWSGIMGMSTDDAPWVGRVPEWLSGRTGGDAGPGEWIAAGYSGEGMVHSWLSGRAVAEMVAEMAGGGGDGTVPRAMKVGRGRWAATGVEDAVVRLAHVRK